MSDRARISLEAVIVAISADAPRILTVDGPDLPQLPSGRLDAVGDRTLELGLRRCMREKTGLELGYAEQLYSFGDLNRDRRRQAPEPRFIGLAYLALVRKAQPAPGTSWMGLYDLFSWEDHRAGPPPVLKSIEAQLKRWAGRRRRLFDRAAIAFGLDGTPWDGVRVLERYELLYEARLVSEWHVDHDQAVPPGLPTGRPLAHDHRRVAATALARLRGKLTYRPVVFELLPPLFTLSQLRKVVEALAGTRLHQQNFRRLVESGGLVEGTGQVSVSKTGRPAELFRFRREVLRERPRPGVGRP
ncbi:MAG TPA: hypothetical protein VJ398_03815, partial [Acidimicrobiia bacterium]|nr:hypothetical protein [Acidimicrobiia bacterium]